MNNNKQIDKLQKRINKLKAENAKEDGASSYSRIRIALRRNEIDELAKNIELIQVNKIA